MDRTAKARILALLWALFIAIGCFLPSSSFKRIEIDQLFQMDKLIHFVLFFVLMALMLLAKSSRAVTGNKAKFVLLIYCVLFGLLVELIQGSSWIGRGFEWFDLLADGLGAFVAMISFRYWHQLLPLAKKYLPFVKNLY